MTSLPNSTNEKKYKYNFILLNINLLTQILNYKLIKNIINILGIIKIIIEIFIYYHCFLDLIVINKGFFFQLKVLVILLLFVKYLIRGFGPTFFNIEKFRK